MRTTEVGDDNQGRDDPRSPELNRRVLAAAWPWLAGPLCLYFWALFSLALLGA